MNALRKGRCCCGKTARKRKCGNSYAQNVHNLSTSFQAGILLQLYAKSILDPDTGKYSATHVKINAYSILAVAVARQVIAKTFKRHISSGIVNEEHINASSASQADEKGRYVSWSSARNSFSERT